MKSFCYSLMHLNNLNFNSNEAVSDFIKSNEEEIDKFETLRDEELARLQSRVSIQGIEIRRLKDELAVLRLNKRSE